MLNKFTAAMVGEKVHPRAWKSNGGGWAYIILMKGKYVILYLGILGRLKAGCEEQIERL